MIKILHTADLHLTEKAKKRWEALEELVFLAQREQVSALVIAGDLFDREDAAEIMRAKLRTVFGKCSFHTLILPGNHDYQAYRSGLYYGDNVKVIRDWRTPVQIEDTVFWGLPYDHSNPGNLAVRLREMAGLMDPGKDNILIYHGELLDAFFSRNELGNEGGKRYMPVRLSFFDALPVLYILAGHFHSRYAAWQLSNGSLFVYPGSPVAVTRRETGRRKANLVFPGEAPREIVLESFHFEELIITLNPFTAHDPLEELARKLVDLHTNAEALLTVEGLFDGSKLDRSEARLAAEIRKMVDGVCAAEPVFNFVDVSHVLEDDLFKKFKTALEETVYPLEGKRKLEEMVIQAFRGGKECS